MTEPRTTDPIPTAWRDQLVLALRVRDVPGARIGDVLAEVAEFCADSGQDAQTAFGDPHEYAASLAAGSDDAAPALRDDLRAAGQVVVGFVGLVVVLATVGSERDLVVTAGWLLGVPLVLVAAVLTVRAVGRSVEAGGWRAAAAPFVVLTLSLVVTVVLGLVLRTPLATVPDAVALVVGVVLLVGDAVVGTLRAHRRPTADLVTAPGADPQETRRRNVRADVLVAWMLPAFALVGVVVLTALDALIR